MRRLRLLAAADPELAAFAEDSEPVPAEADVSQRQLSFIGLGASGRSDVSERHDELLEERLDRPM